MVKCKENSEKNNDPMQNKIAFLFIYFFSLI